MISSLYLIFFFQELLPLNVPIYNYYFQEILLNNLELVFLKFEHFYKTYRTGLFSFYQYIFYLLFHNNYVYQQSTFLLYVYTLDEPVLFLLIILQSFCILMLSNFCTFRITRGTKEKVKSFDLTSNTFHNKQLNMKDLFVCIITSGNNNKQYLVYFYKHIVF